MEWGEYDIYVSHKEQKLSDLMKHPKIIEKCEFLMDSKIFGVQTKFQTTGQLGRTTSKHILYTM